MKYNYMQYDGWTSPMTERKKPATKGRILNDSIYIKYKTRQNESILLED